MGQQLLRRIPTEGLRQPGWAGLLLRDPRAGWLWLVLRVWLGWYWLLDGWTKTRDPRWMVTGEALREQWARPLSLAPPSRPPIAFDGYRGLLAGLLEAQAHRELAPLLAWGEVLIGLALILGAMTGLAAFLGGLLQWNVMLPNSAEGNPMLFVVVIGLILAWRVAGYYGADYLLLHRSERALPGARPQASTGATRASPDEP